MAAQAGQELTVGNYTVGRAGVSLFTGSHYTQCCIPAHSGPSCPSVCSCCAPEKGCGGNNVPHDWWEEGEKRMFPAASVAVHLLPKSLNLGSASLLLSSTVAQGRLSLKRGSPKSKHSSHCPARDASVRLSPSTGRSHISVPLSLPCVHSGSFSFYLKSGLSGWGGVFKVPLAEEM